MPKFRIIISSPDDLDSFTIDTVIENAVDEADALEQLRRNTPPIPAEERDTVSRPKQNLRFVRD